MMDKDDIFKIVLAIIIAIAIVCITILLAIPCSESNSKKSNIEITK